MTAPPRRIAWIVAPPDLCCLCNEPLSGAADVSSWNGAPAHRECVRIHLVQRDPAFREWSGEAAPGPSEEPSEPGEDAAPREDDDEEFG